MPEKENIPLKYLEAISKCEHRLLHCRHFNQNSDHWILDEHTHNYVEMIYFLNGEAQIKTNTGETSLTLYDILVHPANVPHREYVDLHKRQEIINLMICIDTDFDIKDSFVLKDSTGNIRHIFRMIDYHFSTSDLLHEELENNLITILITYLRKSAQELSCSEYNIIDKIIEYVQENYMSDLRVKDLADYIHVSESYLSRILMSHIGISPMKYVNSVRIENAKQILKTDMPIEQISSLVGFAEPKYFSTVFKRETGVTPSAFRKNVTRQ